jgi:hypothetical protein
MPCNYWRDNKQVFSEPLDCESVQVGWQQNKGSWLLQNSDVAVGEYTLRSDFHYLRSDKLLMATAVNSPKLIHLQ